MGIELDNFYMAKAVQCAELALQLDEVPVGAILVKDNTIISSAHNQPISLNDSSAHAEILAIRRAGQNLNNYRLLNTTLYVTLEPCVMCIGAIVHARISRIVFGASDPKAGALGSAFDLLSANKFNHHPEVTSGVMSEQCSLLLKNFFKNKRQLKGTQLC